MSIALMAAAWELDLPQTEKMVLLCLCNYANDEGACWPSRERMAGQCSVTDRSVRRAITALQERGFVERHPRFNNSTIYQLNKDLIIGGTQCPGGTESPARGDTRSPKPSLNHHNPKKKHALPANWEPAEFGDDTESRVITDGWSDQDRRRHIEQFKAHHIAAESRFSNWQAAWAKWTLNSVKFGGNRNGKWNGNRNNGGSTWAIGQELLGSLDAAGNH